MGGARIGQLRFAAPPPSLPATRTGSLIDEDGRRARPCRPCRRSGGCARSGVKGDRDYREKKICRVQETIGSRVSGTRICRTRAEWEDLKVQSRRTIERIQGSTSGCLRGGVCGG